MIASPIGRRIAIIVAVVIVASGAVAIAAVAAERHVATSTQFCVSCHAAEAADSVHPTTGCPACHDVPKDDRLDMFVSSLSGGQPPDHGQVIEAGCERCHVQDDDEEWRSTMHTAGHVAHDGDPPEARCVECHAGSLHGQPQPEEGCLHCHDDVPLLSEPRGEEDCVTCHLFTEEEELPPEGSFRDRVGVNQIHGAARCDRCHNPHEPEPEGFGSTAYCTQCHRGNLQQQIAEAPPVHQQCRSCHEPHGARDDVAVECQRCHAAPRPGGAPTEAWTTSEGVEGVRPGATSHGGQCQKCHRPHNWEASWDVCGNCHADKVQALASMREGTHTGCANCHDQHDVAPTSRVCSNCHEDVHRGGPAPHQVCTSCHNPHNPREAILSSCNRCHGPIRRQLIQGPTRHQTCLTCHNNHGDPKAGTLNRCARCHTGPAASLARGHVPQAHICANCHTPHRFAAGAAVSRCRSCHAFATQGSHQGQCTECHDNHSAPAARVARCQNCHADVRPTVATHAARCNGCHQPHRPKSAAITQCVTCHGSEVRAARAWPAGTPHNGQCPQCHTPHNEGNIKRCPQCHANKANPNHMGSPRHACRGCHAPHRAPPSAAVGWWDRCGTCHRQEAAGAASARPERHRTCNGCHNPLGAGLPSCTNCHSNIRQQLMHRVPQHSNCTNCHATHGTPRISRAQCERCHDDRDDHFPDAPRCQACHPFAD